MRRPPWAVRRRQRNLRAARACAHEPRVTITADFRRLYDGLLRMRYYVEDYTPPQVPAERIAPGLRGWIERNRDHLAMLHERIRQRADVQRFAERALDSPPDAYPIRFDPDPTKKREQPAAQLDGPEPVVDPSIYPTAAFPHWTLLDWQMNSLARAMTASTYSLDEIEGKEGA